jgi:hypothetical protein
VGERVGQAAQQHAVVDELERAPVEADGDAAAGEVVADGVLPAGEADLAAGVDGAVDLDRVAWLAGGDGWWSGELAALVEQPLQVGDGQPGRDGLESTAAAVAGVRRLVVV